MSSIAENLERVRRADRASGGEVWSIELNDVELVAITKTHPAEKVREAVEGRANSLR